MIHYFNYLSSYNVNKHKKKIENKNTQIKSMHLSLRLESKTIDSNVLTLFNIS